MHIQYDLQTKKGVGIHNILSGKSDLPENLVEVNPADEAVVGADYMYLTVDDSDPQNKFVVIPTDFEAQKATQMLIEQREKEGQEIVQYLTQYLNSKAVTYGYDSYHAAMLYKGSSIAKFNTEGQAFSDCADAIWNYLDTHRDAFAATGQPDLATVMANHPKLSEFGLTL